MKQPSLKLVDSDENSTDLIFRNCYYKYDDVTYERVVIYVCYTHVLHMLCNSLEKRFIYSVILLRNASMYNAISFIYKKKMII